MNKILKTIKENLENLQSKNLVYREIRREDVFPFFDANQNDLFVNYLSWNKEAKYACRNDYECTGIWTVSYEP